MWFLPPDSGFFDVSISSAYKAVVASSSCCRRTSCLSDSSWFSLLFLSLSCSLVSVTFLGLRTALHSASVTQFAHDDICCSLAACCCCRPLVIQNELYKRSTKERKKAEGPSRMLCSLRDSGLNHTVWMRCSLKCPRCKINKQFCHRLK